MRALVFRAGFVATSLAVLGLTSGCQSSADVRGGNGKGGGQQQVIAVCGQELTRGEAALSLIDVTKPGELLVRSGPLILKVTTSCDTGADVAILPTTAGGVRVGARPTTGTGYVAVAIDDHMRDFDIVIQRNQGSADDTVVHVRLGSADATMTSTAT